MSEGGYIGKGSTRGPSFSGKVVQSLWRGVPRTAAWPRKRKGKGKTWATEQTEWFRQAQWATKYWPADMQVAANEATAHTPLLPRDIMTMIMAGRAWSVSINGRGVIYPMAAQQDVSESLDAISQTPGNILIRGTNLWTAQPLQAGYGAWFWNQDYNVRGTTTSGSAYCYKGGIWEVHENIFITAVGAVPTIVAGAQYRAIILELNSSNVIQGIQTGSLKSWGTSNTFATKFPIVADLEAGKRYAIMVGRYDGADDYPMPIHSEPEHNFHLPMSFLSFARIAETSPTIGQTVDNASAAPDSVVLGIQTSY